MIVLPIGVIVIFLFVGWLVAIPLNKRERERQEELKRNLAPKVKPPGEGP